MIIFFALKRSHWLPSRKWIKGRQYCRQGDQLSGDLSQWDDNSSCGDEEMRPDGEAIGG